MNTKSRRAAFFVAAVLLPLLFDSIALCQTNIPKEDAITFVMTVEDSAVLKKVVFAVQMEGNLSNMNKADDWVMVGSGFLVKTNNITLGVTCKHVVQPFIKAGKDVFVVLETRTGNVRARCKISYLDPTDDIAILIPQVTPEINKQIQNLPFGENMFDDGSFLVEGRGVIIVGYPLALGVENEENHPVMRLGIIAQYTGRDYFLIDGIASHGNSGSPVFARKVNEARVVGMVTSHMNDTINLFDDNGQLAAQLPYNSGLGRAITMKRLQQAIRNATVN